MTSPEAKSKITLIPPPILFAASFFIGYFIQRLAIGAPHSAPGALRAIGAGLVAVALATAVPALLLFARHRTTVIPHGHPSDLVAEGPYRMTRHPMYVGLGLVYLGVALWTRVWFAIPLLPVPIFLVDRFIIPMEEERLRKRFGEAYTAYCGRVRRWL
jgi:protein-S-isoprenylcysteine O-methyltransferase Ste14